MARTPLPDWRWPRQLASSETFGPLRRRSERPVHSRPAGHYDASSGVVIGDGEGSGPCRRGEAEAQAPRTAQGRSARSGDPPPPAITPALGGFGRAGPRRCRRPLPRPRMLVVGSRGGAGVCWQAAELIACDQHQSRSYTSPGKETEDVSHGVRPTGQATRPPPQQPQTPGPPGPASNSSDPRLTHSSKRPGPGGRDRNCSSGQTAGHGPESSSEAVQAAVSGPARSPAQQGGTAQPAHRLGWQPARRSPRCEGAVWVH